ncbi:hypothetical protein KEM60_01448 [Austwickia sp. TVS 96-490-7B]|uniref:protein-arginine deiminase domain-containing protein n=1 Tax=Austwickia sp. TVS 96-490-7B TaxID=2830843 RepID=UPI001C57B7A5|nr:protein-arginine deiminase domain-containing protein [Austwickia sp. TVS 96-490-7B]MBW3085251.1 hypothetical protein [Austwickia sp. TVS 96-490-7B]
MSHTPSPRLASRIALAVTLGMTGSVLHPLGTASAADPVTPWSTLRADANRDGVVDVDGDGDQESGTATVDRGAVFLANVDDDSGRCKAKDGEKFLPLATLASCHDGADEVVNGPDDEKDLAPLRTKATPSLPADAVGRLHVEGAAARRTHLFLHRGKNWVLVRPTTIITAAELRAGLRLGLEGTDILRDTAAWDGTAKVTLTITSQGTSQRQTVSLRQAPLKLQHNTQKVTRAFISEAGDNVDMPAFLSQFKAALTPSGATLTEITGGNDIWIQDLFEPMYQQMPTAKGGMQTMRVALSSDQVRSGSQAIYQLRGKDIGVVRAGTRTDEDTLNSMGNLESLPPYTHAGQSFPMGRAVIGIRESSLTEPGRAPTPTPKPSRSTAPKPSSTTSRKPTAKPTTPPTGSPSSTPQLKEPGSDGHILGDQNVKPEVDNDTRPSTALVTLLTAQYGVAPLEVDTGFLSVGHVDEIMSVIPAKNSRGWKLAVADPRGGINLIKKAIADGHGSAPLFAGEKQAQTLEQVLKDPMVMLSNNKAVPAMDKNIARLKDKLGLSDDDIVKIPVFYRTEFEDPEEGKSGVGAPLGAASFIPNAVNGIVMGDDTAIIPFQYGPEVGKDKKNIFGDAVKAAYTAAGLRITTVVDKNVYYVGGGDIHCGTNTFRAVPTTSA